MCPCDLLKNCSEEPPGVSSGAEVVVEDIPLCLPYLGRAAVSHKPDKLRPFPSPKGMVTMKGREGNLCISVARLAVVSKKHSDRSAYPSPYPLQAHVQIQINDLFMTLVHHLRWICSVLLRITSAPVEANCFIRRRGG
jgi:hypothetical protein